MKIEIFRRLTLRGWRWFFRVKADNNKVIAQSEGYHNRGDAWETARNLRAKLFDAEIRETGRETVEYFPGSYR